MRPSQIVFFGIAALAIAALAFCTPYGPAEVAAGGKSDLIIIFSGDVQGYLEECG